MIVLITFASFFAFLAMFHFYSKIVGKKSSAIEDFYLATNRNEEVVCEILDLVKAESAIRASIVFPKKYSYNRDWGSFSSAHIQHSNVAERITVRSGYSGSKLAVKASRVFSTISQKDVLVHSVSNEYMRRSRYVQQGQCVKV